MKIKGYINDCCIGQWNLDIFSPGTVIVSPLTKAVYEVTEIRNYFPSSGIAEVNLKYLA